MCWTNERALFTLQSHPSSSERFVVCVRVWRLCSHLKVSVKAENMAILTMTVLSVFSCWAPALAPSAAMLMTAVETSQNVLRLTRSSTNFAPRRCRTAGAPSNPCGGKRKKIKKSQKKHFFLLFLLFSVSRHARSRLSHERLCAVTQIRILLFELLEQLRFGVTHQCLFRWF